MLMTATSLKLVSVQIPTRAEEGGSVRLHCKYDLEGQAPLSTSWYKDDVLFYKFLESGGMAYPLLGANVNVCRLNACVCTLNEARATNKYTCSKKKKKAFRG